MFITAVCSITFYILSIFLVFYLFWEIRAAFSALALPPYFRMFWWTIYEFLVKKKWPDPPHPGAACPKNCSEIFIPFIVQLQEPAWQFVYFCTRPGEGLLIRSNKRKEWQNFFGATFVRLLLQKATFDFFEQVLSTRATCGLLVLNIPRYAVIFSPHIFYNRSTFYLSIHAVSPKRKALITELPEMILDSKM